MTTKPTREEFQKTYVEYTDEDIRRMTYNPTQEDLLEMAGSYVDGLIDMRLLHAYPSIFAQALLDAYKREEEFKRLIYNAFGIMHSRGYAKLWVIQAASALDGWKPPSTPKESE